MRNIRLRLAYDGTRYVGWQVHVFHVHIDSALQPTVAANTVLVWHGFIVRAVNVGVLN